MCHDIHILHVCSACGEQLSHSSSQQWCREARGKGHFGRCGPGLSRIDDESRRDECLACMEAREAQMAQLELKDFAVRRLGWGGRGGKQGRKHDDGDGDGNGGGRFVQERRGAEGKQVVTSGVEMLEDGDDDEDEDNGYGYSW